MRWWRERPVPNLGRDQDVVTPALQRLTDDLLRATGRVDVGSVDQVDPGVEAEIDLAPGVGQLGVADLREVAQSAEGHRSEGECRDLQP